MRGDGLGSQDVMKREGGARKSVCDENKWRSQNVMSGDGGQNIMRGDGEPFCDERRQ